MQKTTNFNLNQWEPHDEIKVEDFNADNAAVDAAVAELAAAKDTLTAAVSKCGNCKIVYGSYTGNGACGSSGANTLTFSHKPVFVAVLPDRSNGSAYQNLLMVRSSPFVYTYSGYHSSECTVTWAKKSVSWYNGSSEAYQFNASGYIYYYVALLAADE